MPPLLDGRVDTLRALLGEWPPRIALTALNKLDMKKVDRSQWPRAGFSVQIAEWQPGLELLGDERKYA